MGCEQRYSVKFTFLTVFWVYFADTIGFRASKKFRFVSAPPYACNKWYLLWSHMNNCLIVLQNLKKWKIIRLFPFLEIELLSFNQVCYSSCNMFSATRKFKFIFCYCNAATLIGGLKIIRLEGDNNVENWLLKAAGQIQKTKKKCYQELALKYLLPLKMTKNQLQA